VANSEFQTEENTIDHYRCSELDFDLPRQPANALTMLPGPALFSYKLIHQAAVIPLIRVPAAVRQDIRWRGSQSGGAAANAETWSLAIIYRPPSSSLIA